MNSNSTYILTRQRVPLVFKFVLTIAAFSFLIASGAGAKELQYNLAEVTDKNLISAGAYDFQVWDPNPKALQVEITAFEDDKEAEDGGSTPVGYRYYNLNPASKSQSNMLNNMKLFYDNSGGFYYTNISPLTSDKQPPAPNLKNILTWENDNLYNKSSSKHTLVQNYIDAMVSTNQNDLEAVQILNQNLSASLPLLTNMLFIIARKSNVTAMFEIYSGIPLLGTEETPANNSSGFGALTAIYDENSKNLFYEFEWELDGDSEAVAAHFHGPAGLGQSAPALISLGPVSGNSGKQTGSVVLTDPQEADLKAGLWYLNIHSNDFPGGEIRGQLFDTSPLESVAVFDPKKGKLQIKNVMVPGLGIFEADLQLMNGPDTLNFELENALLKELDADEDEMEQKSGSD